MQDSAADASIARKVLAGDAIGHAELYDRHAAELYQYCLSMLRDRGRAVGALGITFMIAAGRLAELRDRDRLRPWLYALARDECRRRAATSRTAPSHTAQTPPLGLPADFVPTITMPAVADPVPDGSDDAAQTPDSSGSAGLFAAAVAGLGWDDREVIELCLGHHLIGRDLADALGMPAGRVPATVSAARVRLQRAIGAVFLARTGQADCRELAALLAGWDEQADESVIQRVRVHIGSCTTCQVRERRELPSWGALADRSRAAEQSPPPGVRAQVLALLAEVSTPADDLIADLVIHRAGAFGTGGFPAQRARGARRGSRHSPVQVAGAAAGVAAAGAVVVMFAALPSHGSASPALAQATTSAHPLGTGSAGARATRKSAAKHKKKHVGHAAGSAASATPAAASAGAPSSASSTSPGNGPSSSSSASSSPSSSPAPSKSPSPSPAPSKSSPPPSPSPAPTPSPTKTAAQP